jgi:hypothetical protein
MLQETDGASSFFIKAAAKGRLKNNFGILGLVWPSV